MATQKQYELVYIASPDATEEQLTELQSLIEGIITKANGTIDKADVWGRRRLAYQIGRLVLASRAEELRHGARPGAAAAREPPAVAAHLAARALEVRGQHDQREDVELVVPEHGLEPVRAPG